MIAWIRCGTALVVALLTLIGVAEAQQTGTLSGVVRDAQGGVLPGVTVSAARRHLFAVGTADRRL